MIPVNIKIEDSTSHEITATGHAEDSQKWLPTFSFPVDVLEVRLDRHVGAELL
jgi:hypothetical protein